MNTGKANPCNQFISGFNLIMSNQKNNITIFSDYL
jgi:hypothetical protein